MNIYTLLLFLGVLVFFTGIKILRPVEVGVVEFLGRYQKTASAGFNWILPFLSKPAPVEGPEVKTVEGEETDQHAARVIHAMARLLS